MLLAELSEIPGGLRHLNDTLRAVSKLDKEGHRTKGAFFRLRFESRNKLTST